LKAKVTKRKATKKTKTSQRRSTKAVTRKGKRVSGRKKKLRKSGSKAKLLRAGRSPRAVLVVHAADPPYDASPTSGWSSGKVYVSTAKGIRTRKAHKARRASAKDIAQELGISARTQARVANLLRSKGVIKSSHDR
jgi:hypothetical protein